MSNKLNKRPAMSGWEKWILMTVIIFGLSGIVAYFNVRVFGWVDGAPYLAVVSLMALSSLLITRHVRRYPVTSKFVVAAFIFEILLTVTLAVNATFSLSVMRSMSVAGQGEQTLSANLDTATKFRSPREQRAALEILKSQGPVQTRAAIFSAEEGHLYKLMLWELLLSGIAIFTLIGLSIFPDRDQNGVPDLLEDSPAPSRFPTPSTGLGDRGLVHTANRRPAPPRVFQEGPTRPQ